MATACPPARSIAELLARLGRLPHGESFAAGLNPAQWAALRYFDRANRFSATVTAFARYHGTTQGTASQTVKALVAKGLLERRRDGRDRRSSRIEPTARGREALDVDPLNELEAAAGAIGEPALARLLDGLESMLGRLVESSGGPRFGVCRDCRHLGPCCRDDEGASRCALFNQPLDAVEADRLCVNFDPRRSCA